LKYTENIWKQIALNGPSDHGYQPIQTISKWENIGQANNVKLCVKW